MTGDITVFNEYNTCQNGTSVRIADGSCSKVAGVGSVVISKDITLNSVLFIPKLSYNLLSISKLTQDLGCIAKFSPHSCEFQVLNSGMTIGSAEMDAGLYFLRVNASEWKNKKVSCVASRSKEESDVRLWHYRLGHPNFLYLKRLLPSLFNKDSINFQCEVCQLSKHTRSSYPLQSYKSSHPFHMIHSDIWGPSRVNNIFGSRWFVTFIDDHTRLTWLFLMKEKSDIGRIFQTFHLMIQTQFSTKIQVFKTDNGREYFHSQLGSYLNSHGIIHISSCVETPQQNGVAERKNRHLLEVTRSLMLATHVPKFFWGEAVLTATYLVNRMPSRVLDFQTPFQRLLHTYPHIRFVSQIPLKVFGCTAFVHINQQHRSKLDPKSLKCVFLGYAPNQSGYKCYCPQTKRFYTTMDVTFFEDQPFHSKNTIQGESCEAYYFLDTSHSLRSQQHSLGL